MRIVTIADAIVIAAMTLAVVFGLYTLPGCTAKTFDVSGDPLYEEDATSNDGLSDALSESEQPDTRIGSETDLTDTDVSKLDSAVAETIATTDTVPASEEHRTPTGEEYRSTLPKGVYSPALFAESIEQVKKTHPGLWTGPYDATCNLTSEGHGMEVCQYIQKTGMAVLFCPFGISYVEAFASCPPGDAKVSWW